MSMIVIPPPAPCSRCGAPGSRCIGLAPVIHLCDACDAYVIALDPNGSSPCSAEGCGIPGRFAGFACPGFRATYRCPLHARPPGRPAGFRYHRVRRGVGLRALAAAAGWSPTRETEIESGRARMDRLELARWWRALCDAAARAGGRASRGA